MIPHPNNEGFIRRYNIFSFLSSPPNLDAGSHGSRVHLISGQIPAVAAESSLLCRQRMPQPEWPLSRHELSPLAEILARQFIQRWDMYPRQLPNGRWLAIHEPLHVGLLLDHLRGVHTLGTYMLDADSQGRFMVLDADDEASWRWVVNMAKSLYLGGTSSYLEASRRWGHLWLFFSEKIDGRAIRQFGRGLLDTYGIEKEMVELFPKQDVLRKGPGSQIRLPFGIHRKSHKRYSFYFPTGQTLAPTLREQLKLLGQPETVNKRVFDYFQQRGEALMLKNRKRPFTNALRPIKYQSDLAKMA